MTRAEERAIRQQRRASKRQERERRRAEREARLARRENAKQGAGVLARGDNEPCYASLKNYFPLCYCECGEHIVREDMMFDHDICIDHAEGGGLCRPKLTRKKEETPEGVGRPAPDGAGLPLEREQGKCQKTLAGQLLLGL